MATTIRLTVVITDVLDILAQSPPDNPADLTLSKQCSIVSHGR
jgi:hypothetical protein